MTGSSFLVNSNRDILIEQIETGHHIEFKTRDVELVLVTFGFHRSENLSDNFGKDTPLSFLLFVDLGLLLSENCVSLAGARLTISKQHAVAAGHTDELIHKRVESIVDLFLSGIWVEHLARKLVRVLALGKHVLGVQGNGVFCPARHALRNGSA